MSLCSVYPDFHIISCSFSNSFIAIILIKITYECSTGFFASLRIMFKCVYNLFVLSFLLK